MPDITFRLDGEALQAATTQAILGVLTPEAKEELIDKAIRSILATGESSYDRRSQIEKAFASAVNRAAHQICLDMVKSDPAILSRISELARSTADKILGADPDKMAERMADAFVNSIRKD